MLELARQLIARRSVTPDDAGCIDLLAGLLEPLEFRCERIGANGVDNLWARHGTTPPVLCFAGHTDVVPTGPREEWATDPFEPVVKDGMLYVQAAAGIVADSIPEMEWQETENKARSVLRAAEQVQDGLDGGL